MTSTNEPSTPPLTYLISGPQWIDQAFYNTHYSTPIAVAFAAGAHFILGSAKGVDQFAQQQLIGLAVQSGDNWRAALNRVCVFEKGAKDGRLNLEFALFPGHDSFPERDLAMVERADELIVRLPQYGSGTSGSMLVVEAMVFKRQGLTNWKQLALAVENARRAVVPRESAEFEQTQQKLALQLNKME